MRALLELPAFYRGEVGGPTINVKCFSWPIRVIRSWSEITPCDVVPKAASIDEKINSEDFPSTVTSQIDKIVRFMNFERSEIALS